jgi:hypothetical protein
MMKFGGGQLCLCLAVAAVILSSGFIGCGNAKGETPTTWTLALYINGDNDLERYWEEYSLPALLNIPSSADLSIVAIIDRMSVEGTEMVEISGDSWQVVNTYPEKNFGDGATFSWFLTEVTAAYPSENLVVTGWDHGYAWRYFSNDQTSVDKITMPELEDAITNAGVHIDILSFDACNMAAVEVVYQVSLTGLVDYMVASEETIPMNGFPYDLMFTPLANDASRAPDQVAIDMVDGWAQYYDPLNWATTVGLSAIDVVSLGGSMPALQTWCAEMYDNLAAYKKSYKNALSNAYCAWATSSHVDMGDLGEWLLADSKISDAALRASISAMVAAVDAAVLSVESGKGAEACHGITIWWGLKGDWGTYSAAYTEVAFCEDTVWWDFLDAYN